MKQVERDREGSAGVVVVKSVAVAGGWQIRSDQVDQADSGGDHISTVIQVYRIQYQQ